MNTNTQSGTGQKVADAAVATLGYTCMAAGVVIGAVVGFKWATK